jgi:lipopolysaccharide transport system permease protein
LWLYASPIVYPISSVPEKWRALGVWNPIMGILEGVRSVLARGDSPDMHLLGISALAVLVAPAIAWPLFRKMSQYFADVL